MTAMRVVKGEVVGKTVVLEEALPEGLEVEVREARSDDAADGWTLDEESWKELEEADSGELVSAEDALAQLKSLS